MGIVLRPCPSPGCNSDTCFVGWTSYHYRSRESLIAIEAVCNISPSRAALNFLTLNCSALDSIVSEITEICNQTGVKRVFTFAKDPTRIDSLRRQLGEALQTFQVSRLSYLQVQGSIGYTRQLDSTIENSRLLKDIGDVDVAQVIKALLGNTINKIGEPYFIAFECRNRSTLHVADR